MQLSNFLSGRRWQTDGTPEGRLFLMLCPLSWRRVCRMLSACRRFSTAPYGTSAGGDYSSYYETFCADKLPRDINAAEELSSLDSKLTKQFLKAFPQATTTTTTSAPAVPPPTIATAASMASTSRSPLTGASDTLGKDLDKKDVDSYLTSPRRRSVVIDDDRCVEIPIQMNPQLDASKLRPVAGRPPTPIPSDEEEDEEDEKDSPSCEEGKLGSGERVNIDCYDKKPETPEKPSVASNFTDGSLH